MQTDIATISQLRESLVGLRVTKAGFVEGGLSWEEYIANKTALENWTKREISHDASLTGALQGLQSIQDELDKSIAGLSENIQKIRNFS